MARGKVPAKPEADFPAAKLKATFVNPARPDHPTALTDKQLLAECDIRRLRRSGPGGQHRNKVETAVVLKHLPSGVDAEANERRSQLENQRVALFRLRVNLALEVRVPDFRPGVLSELWQSRCRGGKISVNSQHDDFPAMLAEALDAIDACEYDLKAASTALTCTTSQLVKFVKLEPRAWSLINLRRGERGLPRLK